jgi:integrase
VDKHGGKHYCKHFSPMASIHRKKRSPYWQGYWRDANGKPHYRSTKQTTRKEARRVVELWELAAKRKKNAAHVRSVFAAIYRDAYGAEMPTTTLRQYSTRWLEEKHAESSLATHRAYQTTVSDFLAFLGRKADMDIAAISRTDIVAWRSSLSARLHSTTVNRHIKILRMLFKAAQRDELVAQNPVGSVSGVAAKADDASGRRPFSLDEIRALLEVADSEWQSLIKFGFFTGQRLTDLCLLSWDAIDLVRNEIRFVTLKTGKRMVLPVCDPLRTHILSLSGSDDPSAPLHPRAYATIRRQGYASNVSRWFAQLLSRAGLRGPYVDHKSRGIGRSHRRTREELSFHSLRHSATTVLHEAGVPASVAQALIGHDSEASHKNYVGVGMEAVRQAAARLPAL